MSLADDLTAMILTYNEEANIARTLDALGWVGEILIVDSGSTDATLDIVRRYPRARVVTRAFDSFAEQCNYGLSRITTAWILSLDADYELSEALGREICSLAPAADVAGYRASFVYRIFGRPLSGALYPARTVLYRRDGAAYRNEGHGHRVTVVGNVHALAASIYHDDRKPLARWFASQAGYAGREADYLLAKPVAELGRTDRVRRMGWPAPALVFIYTLVWKRCLLDGWAGWYYALQRTLAETMIALALIDRRLRSCPRRAASGPPQ